MHDTDDEGWQRDWVSVDDDIEDGNRSDVLVAASKNVASSSSLTP